MAVGALDPMDIVGALWIEVRRVHFFYIEFAFALGRVTGGARSASVFIVPVMTGDATESFMNAGGCAVVTCPDLRTPVMVGGNRTSFGNAWTVALVAHRLPRICAHLHQASTILQLRNVKRRGCEMDALTPIEECKRTVHSAARD